MPANTKDSTRIAQQWRDAFVLYRADDVNDHLAALTIAQHLQRLPGHSAEPRSRLNWLIADIYTDRLDPPHGPLPP